MDIAQQKAWDILTDLEKSALSLVVVSEKSKQEASIILNIYPYKFTEIYSRARKLFTTLTHYFESYEDLVPRLPGILPEARSFIHTILTSRRKPTELILIIPDFRDLVKPGALPAFWDETLRQIQLDPSEHATDFFTLLRVFDQWNNFRILPSEYRDPSPFPRRRNREFKKIYEQLNKVSDLGWHLIDNKFGTVNPPKAWIPTSGAWAFSMSIRLTKPSLTYCTKNRLPVFSTEKQASDFSEASYDFSNLQHVSSYSSQKFWANFRVSMQKAINYEDLLNIKPGDFGEFNARDRKFLAEVKVNIDQKRRLPKGQSKSSIFY